MHAWPVFPLGISTLHQSDSPICNRKSSRHRGDSGPVRGSASWPPGEVQSISAPGISKHAHTVGARGTRASAYSEEGSPADFSCNLRCCAAVMLGQTCKPSCTSSCRCTAPARREHFSDSPPSSLQAVHSMPRSPLKVAGSTEAYPASFLCLFQYASDA